jgi:hypothetical protein
MSRTQLVSFGIALVLAAACARPTILSSSAPPAVSSIPSTGSAVPPASSGASLASASASARSNPPAPSAPAYDASAALVWIKPDRDNPRIVTRWIEDKQGAPSVEREASLPIVASDTALWSLSTVSTKRRFCPCAGAAVNPDGVTNSKLSATQLATKKSVVVAKAEPEGFPKCTGDLASYESSIAIVGVAGSIVIYDNSETGMGCMAAHPYFGEAPGYFDVATAAPVKLLPPSAAMPALVAESGEIVRKEFGDCISDSDTPTEFFSVRPAFTKDGVMTAHYLFTHAAPYACGVGPSHYTVPAEIDAKSLPAQIEKWQRAPVWLASYLGAQHEQVVGVSPLPAALDRSAAISQFTSAK